MEDLTISRRKFLTTTAMAAAASTVPFNYAFTIGRSKRNGQSTFFLNWNTQLSLILIR